jgi:hypothetical protein
MNTTDVSVTEIVPADQEQALRDFAQKLRQAALRPGGRSTTGRLAQLEEEHGAATSLAIRRTCEQVVMDFEQYGSGIARAMLAAAGSRQRRNGWAALILDHEVPAKSLAFLVMRAFGWLAETDSVSTFSTAECKRLLTRGEVEVFINDSGPPAAAARPARQGPRRGPASRASSTSVRDATVRLLEEKLEIVHAWEAGHPLAAARVSPTVPQWWARYGQSMITVQTPIGPSFHAAMLDDDVWRKLLFYTHDEMVWSEEAILRCLLEHGVRFAEDKVARIRRAWDDGGFEEICTASESITARLSGMSSGPDQRPVELGMVDVLLRELPRGCGVGPKIARLMMIWSLENGIGAFGSAYRHVVPLDSRWLNEFRRLGVHIPREELGNEHSYRRVEQAVCDACYELDVLPFEADGAVFGWMAR